MAGDRFDRIRGLQCAGDARERLILGGLERRVVRAFELDADREIVASRSSAPRRFTGVPRALFARDELHERAVAANEEMRRHSERRYAGVIGMRGGVQTILKELDDARAAELPRRQADRVYDEEIDRRARGTLVAVRRRDERHTAREPRAVDPETGLIALSQLFASSSSLMPSRSMR